MLAHDKARAEGGAFILRIEDIDQTRARSEWEALIHDDLRWLGLTWEEPVLRQSDRMGAYRDALARLWARGLLFPCHCNRRDILAAASAPNEGEPVFGPDGVVYPGTCRDLPRKADAPLPDTAVLRLNMARALKAIDGSDPDAPLSFTETGGGSDQLIEATKEHMLQNIGDIVLARRDMGTSYHLSVVIDDAAQDITHVVRGADLADATPIHVLLQRLLNLPTPVYHHHRLIRDDAGKRLAKRDDARAIRKFREDGASPTDIRRMVGL